MSNRSMRIISLLPSATEIICAFNLEDALVGVTHECDYPLHVASKPKLTASRISHEHMTSHEIDFAVRHELAHLDGHGSIYELNEKLLHELNPDLVVTQELCDVCAVNYKTVLHAARLFNSNIPVVSLEPTTIADILGNIRTIGELTSTTAKAEEVVNRLTARLDSLAASVANVKHRPRTLMLEWLEPPFAPGHWVPEQVALAGGEASFGRAGQASTTTTAEEIQAYAPEVIVLIPCGYYKEDTLKQLQTTRLPAGWSKLPAVLDNQVWAVDATSYFSRPGPRVVDGAEILARILHPEVFGEPTPEQAIRVEARLMLEAATTTNLLAQI